MNEQSPTQPLASAGVLHHALDDGQRAQGETPEARAALGDLCEAYWTPVFRFLRREGRGEDESRELTQAFFAKLLAGAGIGEVDPAKGRFRSYLLGSLKHFLANQRRDANREKRGGGAVDGIDRQRRHRNFTRPAGGGPQSGGGRCMVRPSLGRSRSWSADWTACASRSSSPERSSSSRCSSRG